MFFSNFGFALKSDEFRNDKAGGFHKDNVADSTCSYKNKSVVHLHTLHSDGQYNIFNIILFSDAHFLSIEPRMSHQNCKIPTNDIDWATDFQ